MAKAVEKELFESSEVGLVEEKPYVHNMIRTISKNNVPIGEAEPVYMVDGDVGAWVKDGYDLMDTHYLGEDANGWMVLYILVKKDVI